MATVAQLSWAPTNKLTASIVAGAGYDFVQPALAKGVDMLAAMTDIAWTLAPGSSTDMLLQFGLMALVGYFVKDKPNVAPEPRYDEAA